MRKNASQENPQDETSFEDALAKLEKIVSKMEEGKLPIEDMMRNFEEASKLAALCSAKLKVIERKIEVLVGKKDKDGEWTDFEAKKKNGPQDSLI
jgi:exodeoxyribonuclease VII small subunit